MKNELRKIGEELTRLARRFSEIIAGTSKGEDVPPGLADVSEALALPQQERAPDKVVGLRADSIDAKELAEQVLAAGGCSRCGRRADPGELPSMIDLDSAGVESPSWTCRRCVPPLVILGPGGDFTREVPG